MERSALMTKMYSSASPSRFGLAMVMSMKEDANLDKTHDHTQHYLQHEAEYDELCLELDGAGRRVISMSMAICAQ